MATRSSRESKRFLKEAETQEKSMFTSSSYGLRYPCYTEACRQAITMLKEVNEANGNEVAIKPDVNEDSDASLESSNIEEKNPR